MKKTGSTSVIEALEHFVVRHNPFAGFTLLSHCKEIHVDAGSQLMSREFENWCSENKIKLMIAAPHHQEMNGVSERTWQSVRRMSFALCNGARVGFPHFHHALMCAQRVVDALPGKNCKIFRNNQWRQSCPELLWHRHKKTVNVGNAVVEQ